MRNSVANGDQLKALSSEIVERFSKLDSLQSEDEESKNGSSRDDLDERDCATAVVAHSVRDRKKSSIATRVSNPSSEDPKFLVIPEDVEAARGEAASFKCVVEATPNLDVFWFTDEGGEAGKELEESVKYSLGVEESTPLKDAEEGGDAEDSQRKIRSTHELRIFDVGDADAGRYYCVCINSMGRNASIFHVDCRVNENKRLFRSPAFVDEMMDLRATEGEDVVLSCRVSGFPKPRVVFQRNEGSLIENGGKMKIDEEEEGVYSLKISQVTPDLEGRYVAFAVNAAGAVESAANVLVERKPARSGSGPKSNSFAKTPKVAAATAVKTSPRIPENKFDDEEERLLPVLPEAENIVEDFSLQESAPVLSIAPSLRMSSKSPILESSRSPLTPRKKYPVAPFPSSSPLPPPRSSQNGEKPKSRSSESPSTSDGKSVAKPGESVSKPKAESVPSTKPAVDPLAALRPSSAGSSRGGYRGDAAAASSAAPQRPDGNGGFYVIPDDDDLALPGTQNLRQFGTRNNSSRKRYKRDYYINRKPGNNSEKSDFDDDTSSIASASTSLSSPRKEGEEDLDDLYIIPSSGHDKNSSYASNMEEEEEAASSRARGDGSSSFESTGSNQDIEAALKQQRADQQRADQQQQPRQQKGSSTKKALPSVRELSAAFDRRGSFPSVADAKPVVDDFLRMGSITARSLTKKGRELLHEVVRPSSASNPVKLSPGSLAGSRTGSTSSLAELRSSFRSSVRSFAGMKVSNVDDGRTTPDGASLGGGEEGEEEEENNAIFV